MKFFAEPLLAVYEKKKRHIFGGDGYTKKIFVCQFNEDGEFETEDQALIDKLKPKFRCEDTFAEPETETPKTPAAEDPFVKGFMKAAAEIAARKAAEAAPHQSGDFEKVSLTASPQGEAKTDAEVPAAPEAPASSNSETGNGAEPHTSAGRRAGDENSQLPAAQEAKIYRCKQCEFETDSPGKIGAHVKSKHPKGGK